MSRPKIIATCTVLICVLAAGLMIPIPWHREATFIVEPHDVQHVYSTTPGFLRTQFVREGQTVNEGETVMLIDNPEMEDKLLEMYVQRKVVQQEIRVHEANNSLAELAVAEEKLHTIREQIADYEQRLAELELVAPCSGYIVAPQANPEPKVDETRVQLATWVGTPLEPRNLGCFLDERTQVLSVAPDNKFQATLLIDQSDINDIKAGTEVDLKFDHLPETTRVGRVEKFSDEPLTFVPPLLSNKLGGQVPTTSDEQGRERLVSPAYQTTVVLEQDVPLLRTGMRGRARFLVSHRSAWEWIWRYLTTTFRFRL